MYHVAGTRVRRVRQHWLGSAGPAGLAAGLLSSIEDELDKEHFDRPLGRNFWSKEAKIHPQKFPRHPQQDARSRRAITDMDLGGSG